MTVSVTTFPPTTSIRAAYLRMIELGVRHAPVVARGKLLGVVSNRDLLIGARRQRGRLLLSKKTVADVMTAPPFTANKKTTVAAMAQLMVDEKIDSLPIVSPRNELLGLVTSSDLLRLLTDVGAAPPMLPFEFHLESRG